MHIELLNVLLKLLWLVSIVGAVAASAAFAFIIVLWFHFDSKLSRGEKIK